MGKDKGKFGQFRTFKFDIPLYIYRTKPKI